MKMFLAILALVFWTSLVQVQAQTQSQVVTQVVVVVITNYVVVQQSQPVAGSYPTPATGYPTPATGYPTPATGYPTPVTGYPTTVTYPVTYPSPYWGGRYFSGGSAVYFSSYPSYYGYGGYGYGGYAVEEQRNLFGVSFRAVVNPANTRWSGGYYHYGGGGHADRGATWRGSRPTPATGYPTPATGRPRH